MTHPYIPLYVDDYEAATAHLSLEEDGLYNRILRLCWRTPGCSLPDDHAWIARKVRLSLEDFDRIAGGILSDFFTVKNGRIFQKRLRDEYETISRKQKARKKAGKAGGDAKALKIKETEASKSTDLLTDTRALPEPYPEPEPKPDNKKVQAAQRERFAEFWLVCPKKVGKGKAETLFAKACQETAPDLLIAAMQRYAKSQVGKDPTYIAHPTTWLSQKRWLDEDGSTDPPATVFTSEEETEAQKAALARLYGEAAE